MSSCGGKETWTWRHEETKVRLVGLCVLVSMCLLLVGRTARAAELPLNLIQLPPGFKIDLYAKDVPNARSMTLGPNGTLFVGSRTAGNVYAIVDDNHDFKADHVYTIASHLAMPNGVAFQGTSLYVAEIGRILRFDNIESNLEHPLQPAVVTEQLPKDTWHGWKYLQFGPDGLLYVPVGAPCNVCENKDFYASILRMQPNGDEIEVFATGIRNTVGFDWDPVTHDLWFTDNGRDELGNDIPPDELNRAPKSGLNFGFPYCHGKAIADPELGKLHACLEFTPPEQELGPHVAALGMKFYTGGMFPSEYKNQIFIAEHGSWNRSQKIGYRISLVELKDHHAVSYKTFAEGWKQGEEVWGRPVDLLVMPDGSLLVSDDHAGAIYRISYQGS
jgi:glucose/arabinose dehydrogenase